MGCGADTYATAEGCMACPPGCNSPPFSSACNCQAALNIKTSNNMFSSTYTPSYPGFTAQEKNAVFAILLIFTLIIIFLISFVSVLYQKQKRICTEIFDRHDVPIRDPEEEQQHQHQQQRRNHRDHRTHNHHSHHPHSTTDPNLFNSQSFDSRSNSFLTTTSNLNDMVDHHPHILTSNLFQNNNNLQVT